MFDETKITLNEYKEKLELYKNSIPVTCEIIDKETAKNLRTFEGEKIYYQTVPKTKEETFERFNKYTVVTYLIHLIEDFNKHPINHKRLTDELETINEWINDAIKIKFDEATNIYNKNFNALKDMQNEYVKLYCDYYDTKEFFSYFTFFGNNAFHLKAKYFLFKNWLENEIKNIENKTNRTNLDKNRKPETEKMYFKIGLLFAENKIYRILNNGTYEYYHLEKKFKSVNALHKHLGYTRKYIDDTFKELKTPHNIYSKLRYMKNIVDYCNKNEIQIHLEFSNKYDALMQMQS